MGAVDVKQTAEHELTLEWDSSAANDMIADSTLSIITEIDKSPASVKSMILCDPISLIA
jgi:cleavage and polyadenylation specificity factor subunit 3